MDRRSVLALTLVLVASLMGCGSSVVVFGEGGGGEGGTGEAAGATTSTGTTGAGGAGGEGGSTSSSSGVGGASPTECALLCDLRAESCPTSDLAACIDFCEINRQIAVDAACLDELEAFEACWPGEGCLDFHPAGQDEAEPCFEPRVALNACKAFPGCVDTIVIHNGIDEHSCFGENRCDDEYRWVSCGWDEGATTTDCRCYWDDTLVGECSSPVNLSAPIYTCATASHCCEALWP